MVDKPSPFFNSSVFTRSWEKILVDKLPKYAPTSPVPDRSNIDKSSPTSPPSPKSVSDKGHSDIVGPIARPAKQAPTVDQPEPKVLRTKPMPNRPHSPLPEEGSLRIPRPLKVKRPDIENPSSVEGA